MKNTFREIKIEAQKFFFFSFLDFEDYILKDLIKDEKVKEREKRKKRTKVKQKLHGDN